MILLNYNNNLVHAIRYCYQPCERQSNFIDTIRLLLIVIAIMCSNLADWSILVMGILLITEALNKLFFQKLPDKIDLNRVEHYLRNITNIIQVLSIELYYVTPKIKIIHIKLNATIEDIAARDRLKKQIKFDLCKKFGVTESLIDITSGINTIDQELYPLQELTLNGKPYNLDLIQIQLHLNPRRQASIDLN